MFLRSLPRGIACDLLGRTFHGHPFGQHSPEWSSDSCAGPPKTYLIYNVPKYLMSMDTYYNLFELKNVMRVYFHATLKSSGEFSFIFAEGLGKNHKVDI